ncbi:MAG: alpha/beta hydrolase family protein [Limisphaerales bacterium]
MNPLRLGVSLCFAALAASDADAPQADALRALDANVLTTEERAHHALDLRRDAQAAIAEVNRRDREAWAALKSRADWEKFVAPRIAALRKSLGEFPPVPAKVPTHVARTVEGEGFRIECLVYESRPGVFVTANLYLPASPPPKLPAFVVIHSHHNPKTQSELQDMGMTWARAGCAVLVPDQLGYGERRDHQPGNRQDYRYRYVSGLQLSALGGSLMGWMAWDTMRGLDVVLQRAPVDREKIILLGSVAGGGDPAAVVGALDPRFTCVVPFNFGGPQPETRYPLPADAAATFNYLGSGSWDSTRNLSLSGRDGFLPWVIVGSLAPRRLIYAHEFSWDRERDPVWRRLEQIFAWENAPAHLAFTTGHGLVSGRAPEASHCNNIGRPHRQRIHAALEQWFGLRVEEYSKPLPAEELRCWTPDLRAQLKPRPLHEIYREQAASQAEARTKQLLALPPERWRERLRAAGEPLLGHITLAANVRTEARGWENAAGFAAEKLQLEVERGFVVPTLLLRPAGAGGRRLPVVVCIAQQGKAAFLKERSEDIATLLGRGVAVCLPDLRGTGEVALPGSRGQQSEATSLSATSLMLGQPLLGARLRDLRSVLVHLRSRTDMDATRLALWGDSFAPRNERDFSDPLLGEGSALLAEPAGGMLVRLGAVFEPDVRAVLDCRSWPDTSWLFQRPYLHVPHDAVVPGAARAVDPLYIAALLPSESVRTAEPVSARNTEANPPGRGTALFNAAERKLSLRPHQPRETASYGDWLAAALLRSDKPAR